MDPELRRQLAEEFAPEVRSLEGLLDRDLGVWLSPDGPGKRPGRRDPDVASERRAR
jgi:hypothetical protein